jgi:hypothetical protein
MLQAHSTLLLIIFLRIDVNRKKRKIDRPSWAESRDSVGLAATMLLMFLSYTFFMFSYFQYPEVPTVKGTAYVYFSTIGVLTLFVVSAALFVKFLKKRGRGNGNR